ncbi:hypothetical protein CLOP_g23778 [Closterium sp. NIES-67]|nr:hypothetical protein CLOP_g23778 [Closterium sp. NIES-67]
MAASLPIESSPRRQESQKRRANPYIVAGALLVVVFLGVQYNSSRSCDAELQLQRQAPEDSPGRISAAALNHPYYSKAQNALDLELCRAEEAYAANKARREASLQNLLQPAVLSVPDMLTKVIAPMYPCPREQRLGVWGEGGKWVCMLPTAFQSRPVVYSVGSKESYSFEEDIAKATGATPLTFDPFISQDAQQRMLALPFLRYFPEGLSGRAKLFKNRKMFSNYTFFTLPELMSTHHTTYIDVLKIDCEGCEIEVIRDLEQAMGGDPKARLVRFGGRLPFGQLLVEFHKIHVPKVMLPLIYAIENLGYRIFHMEMNPLCSKCMEVSFIHESLVQPSKEDACFADDSNGGGAGSSGGGSGDSDSSDKSDSDDGKGSNEQQQQQQQQQQENEKESMGEQQSHQGQQ